MAAKKKKAKESSFQHSVIKELEERYPGCVVMKNATGFKNGFPDITMYYGPIWAMLECKREEDADKRPNQDYWVERLNRMSFARIIYPENRVDILGELDTFVKGAAV